MPHWNSSSLESNSHTASQEIPCLLWISKFHYRAHNSTSILHILSKISPVHTATALGLIIIGFSPVSPKGSLPFRFSNKNSECKSELSLRTAGPSQYLQQQMHTTECKLYIFKKKKAPTYVCIDGPSSGSCSLQSIISPTVGIMMRRQVY